MWRPRGCQPQDFSFCVNGVKFGTDIEKWCFYSLFYKRVCMWNKNCVRAFHIFCKSVILEIDEKLVIHP